jgi:hypothetical protein
MAKIRRPTNHSASFRSPSTGWTRPTSFWGTQIAIIGGIAPSQVTQQQDAGRPELDKADK